MGINHSLYTDHSSLYNNYNNYYNNDIEHYPGVPLGDYPAMNANGQGYQNQTIGYTSPMHEYPNRGGYIPEEPITENYKNKNNHIENMNQGNGFNASPQNYTYT